MASALHEPCLCPSRSGLTAPEPGLGPQGRAEKGGGDHVHVGTLTPMEHVSISLNSSPTRIFIAQHS